LRHGLAANTLLLSNESPERFEMLHSAYVEQFRPANDFEADLVEQMVAAKWRQRRLWGIESALFDHEMDTQEEEIDKKYEQIDQPTRLALAFKSLADNSNSLHLLTRYEARLHRQYEKALEQLLAVRAANLPIEPSPTNEHPQVDPPVPSPAAPPLATPPPISSSPATGSEFASSHVLAPLPSQSDNRPQAPERRSILQKSPQAN
jgi:hypothetical protein